MTGDGMTLACPDCDSANVSSSQERESERKWFCGGCRTYFADPVLRESRPGVKPGSTAAQLLEMDADDIGRSA